jgi:PAS domain S-box-containing protein
MSTEGNRPEAAVTSSEQELRLLVETIPTLVWRAAPDGNFDYVNKRMLEYLGAPLSEVIGWGWMDKVHPDDVGFKVRSWLQNLQSGKPHDVVCRIRGADGRYRWFEVRGEPLRASDGAVLSWYGILIDIDDRRKAEDALRDSEYKLRQITETQPGLLWSNAPDGDPTHVNQRMLEYSGMRFEDFKHRGWEAFVHPADYPETARAFFHAIQTGASYEGVMRLRRADGEFRWHHARCEPLRDPQGRIIQWYGLSVDIEERKQAEDRLRRSEAYLAEAQRLSHTGSFGWTPATGEVHWSDETFRILEYDPSIKPTIERALQRVHPDDVAMMRRILDETSRGETDFDNAHRLLMPDGSVKFMHVLSHVLRDAAGNLEIAGAFMDVSENTRLYRELAEREAKIRRLVEANIIGVFVGDFDGRILEANDAFLRIVGYDRADLAAGRINWKDLTPRDWRHRDALWIEEHKRTGVRPPIEKEYSRKDGTRVPVLLGSATFEEGGNQSVAFVLDLTERKHAERAASLSAEALRRSEAHLAEAQKLSHTGAVAYNGTAILFASEETYHIWGFDPAQGLPSREVVFQRIHPGDRDWLNAEVRRAVGEKRRFSTAYRILLPDGTVKHLETIGQPVFSASGKLVEIFATQTDVTERKRAEQALQRSQFYLSEGQRLAHMGSWALNPTGFFDHWSHELFQVYGLDPQRGPPTVDQYLATVHPLDRDFMAETIRRMHAERCGCDVKKRIVRPDGEIRYIRCVGIPVIEDQLLKGFLGSAMDITEQELLTRELERREAYLAEAQALSQTGSAAFNGTTLLYWSDETYRILGFDPRDGVPSYEAAVQRTHPDDQERVREQARRAVQQKTDYKLEYRILLPGGTVKHIEMNAHPKFSASGELVEVVSTIIDVTERKRAREEHQRLRQLESDLAHMNRLSMMGELAASLAHEITQPIATARNNARAALNFLEKQPSDLGEVREALSCVVGDADRAGVIIDRMRDHIRKAPPRNHRFDLNEAINEVIVLARSAIAENDVSVQTRLTEGLVPVEGDRVQLQQVLLNLVLNAAEAMSAVDEGARALWISTEQSRTGVLVTVRDSGPGIDPERIERVFDAFYTTKADGVGMGLSICRSIIDAHGGRLWADANEPRGAAFQFTLPGSKRSS